jgi:hypothetical protein
MRVVPAAGRRRPLSLDCAGIVQIWSLAQTRQQNARRPAVWSRYRPARALRICRRLRHVLDGWARFGACDDGRLCAGESPADSRSPISNFFIPWRRAPVSLTRRRRRFLFSEIRLPMAVGPIELPGLRRCRPARHRPETGSRLPFAVISRAREAGGAIETDPRAPPTSF